jgi:4-hydroxybenzoate polyprenyltransferase/phosphoserine phosphatase
MGWNGMSGSVASSFSIDFEPLLAAKLETDILPAVPLCVDLDGTLIRSDMLIEGMLASVFNPMLYRELLRLRTGSRAAFKSAVATASTFDPALLPYHEPLLAYLREQKALGRRLVLVTAADAAIAHRVAAHLGLFDEVLASDGVSNLKGLLKRDALIARFGRGGFSYAGDSRADLEVWQAARSGILVNARKGVASAARRLTLIETEFDDGRPWLGLLRAMRPHQWAKNLLVFVPLLVSGEPLDGWSLAVAVMAFAAFSLTASGIYLLNDLADLAADRSHSRKRRRPFASGALPLTLGLAAAVVAAGSGLALAWAAGILGFLVLYALLSVSYSVKLKELPLVDVYMLAALYSIRMVAGGEATGCRVSLWLFAFSSFLFLSLALVKRVGELIAVPLGRRGQLARRGYQVSDMIILQMFGTSSAVAAGLVLALFIQNRVHDIPYGSSGLLWGLVPLVMFWQCRIWLATARGYMHDDPIVYAAKDWVSWLVAALAIGLMVATRAFG